MKYRFLNLNVPHDPGTQNPPFDLRLILRPRAMRLRSFPVFLHLLQAAFHLTQSPFQVLRFPTEERNLILF